MSRTPDTEQPGPEFTLWADLPLIERTWSASGAFTNQTHARAAETLARFVIRLTKQGIREWRAVTPDHCAGFIHAHTSASAEAVLATRHARRTTLRMAFRTLRELGHPVGDPTLDIALPPKSARAARPLTDDEVTMCRAASRLMAGGSLRHAVIWALAEATAVTSEITVLRLSDVDNPANPQQIALPGTRRHDPRHGELTTWGRSILARHCAAMARAGVDPDTRLIYRGRAYPGGATAQATTCNAVADVLRTCHLHAEPDVRPASVRGWIGRGLYDGGLTIDQVALRLGLRSLDATAEDIALDWRGQR